MIWRNSLLVRIPLLFLEMVFSLSVLFLLLWLLVFETRIFLIVSGAGCVVAVAAGVRRAWRMGRWRA